MRFEYEGSLPSNHSPRWGEQENFPKVPHRGQSNPCVTGKQGSVPTRLSQGSRLGRHASGTTTKKRLDIDKSAALFAPITVQVYFDALKIKIPFSAPFHEYKLKCIIFYG